MKANTPYRNISFVEWEPEDVHKSAVKSLALLNASNLSPDLKSGAALFLILDVNEQVRQNHLRLMLRNTDSSIIAPELGLGSIWNFSTIASSVDIDGQFLDEPVSAARSIATSSGFDAVRARSAYTQDEIKKFAEEAYAFTNIQSSTSIAGLATAEHDCRACTAVVGFVLWLIGILTVAALIYFFPATFATMPVGQVTALISAGSGLVAAAVCGCQINLKDVADFIANLFLGGTSPAYKGSEYRAFNPDLEPHLATYGGGETEEQKNRGALEHYRLHGMVEGRIACRAISPHWYLYNCSDLVDAFGSQNNRYVLAVRHVVEFGIREGRQTAPWFHIDRYIALNQDVRDAYGGDRWLCYEHWLSFGRNEGRATI